MENNNKTKPTTCAKCGKEITNDDDLCEKHRKIAETSDRGNFVPNIQAQLHAWRT
jgi:hypothetical protein